MSFSLRTRIGAVAFGALVVGCPTGSDPGSDPLPLEDGGGPGVDGGPGPGIDAQTSDGAKADSAPPPPAPCSRLTVVCKDGEKCEGAPDCVSKVCRTGICQTAAPADGAKNGDETDVDCGGSKAPACASGKGCLIAADCASSVCTAGVCQAPSPTDGIKNGDETGKDCGGAVAPKCPTGEGCLTDTDCDKVKCDLVQKKCLAPTHSDGILNLDETGIDCGGPTLAVARCAAGQGCAADGDCANTRCNPGTLVCDPATATDGLKNGTETDVDCGGGAPTNAPGCGAGLTCVLDADCGSVACNYAKKCVESRSCKVQHGGDTCGPAGNESCCVSLAAGGATIDKYNITAGRMRAFVTATNGNMRGYINANTPAWWTAAWSSFLPTMLDNGQSAPDDAPAYTGVYQELGPYTHGAFGPANEGCYITGNGARTYRLPDAVNTRIGDPQRYSQSFLDDRSLNCVTVHIIAAFCAWDGGRLPTRAEMNVAWGPQTYPWGPAGAANRPLGYRYGFATNPLGTAVGSYNPYQAAPDTAPPLPASNLQWANFNMNFWGGGTQIGSDFSIFVSPPGRFPNGNGPFGHADLAGNVFNSLDINGANNAYWTRSGSWQGHPIPWSAPGGETNFAVHNKYWAMGGRCAR